MEGIENPATRSLRVMRFNFEANELLHQELALQLNEKRRQETPLRFYASRQLVVGMDDFYQFEGELQKIARRFRNFNEPIRLKPTIGTRDINADTTRFRLAPVDQAAFDAMTSLEIVGDENTIYPEPMPQFPNKIENQPESGHYLFVDVATDALLTASERKMATRRLIDKMAASRFWLHTSSLSTVRDIHYRPTNDADEIQDDNHLRTAS